MKIIKILPLLVLSLFVNQSNAQSTEAIRQKLQSINKTIEQFYLTKNAPGLVKLYADSFTYIPEYKPALVKKESLKDFYSQWFNSVTNTSFEKRIYKVEEFSSYVLETGNFSLHYAADQGIKKEYAGNYMVMWKHEANNKLVVIAEAFGSGSYINATEVPYNNVQIMNPYILDQDQLSSSLAPQIAAFDKALVKSIEEGNGKARAEGFTKDGIYMPHFGTILDGMDALLPYMLKTYTPEAKLYVKNTYREIFSAGNFVFLTGHFKGGWGDRSNGGKFEGNMFNLMKREANGQLYMYRQIANNDQ